MDSREYTPVPLGGEEWDPYSDYGFSFGGNRQNLINSRPRSISALGGGSNLREYTSQSNSSSASYAPNMRPQTRTSGNNSSASLNEDTTRQSKGKSRAAPNWRPSRPRSRTVTIAPSSLRERVSGAVDDGGAGGAASSRKATKAIARVLPRKAVVLSADDMTDSSNPSGQMVVVNESTWRCVAFKVKTNAAKQYRVSPSCGVIQPGDGAVIRLQLARPVNSDERAPKHVFQVHVRRLAPGRHSRKLPFQTAWDELSEGETHISKRRTVLSHTPERRRWAADKARRASEAGSASLPRIAAHADADPQKSSIGGAGDGDDGEFQLAPEERALLDVALADAARRAAQPDDGTFSGDSETSGARSDESDDELLELALSEERRWKRLVGVQRQQRLQRSQSTGSGGAPAVGGLGVDVAGNPVETDSASALAFRRASRVAGAWKDRMAAEMASAPSRDVTPSPSQSWKHALALHLATVPSPSTPTATVPPRRPTPTPLLTPAEAAWPTQGELRHALSEPISQSPASSLSPSSPWASPSAPSHPSIARGKSTSRFLLPPMDGMSAADRHAIELAIEADEHDFLHPFGPNAPGMRRVREQSGARVEDAAELGGADVECLICFDRVADTILIPCGHAEYCGACLRLHERKNGAACPTCREPWIDTQLKDFG